MELAIKYCDICGEPLHTDREIYADLCEKCLDEFQLSDDDLLVDEMIPDEDLELFEEEATQVGDVAGGRISVFGSEGGNHFEDEWFNKLLKLNENLEEEFNIESSIEYNMGGGTMVEFGKLSNGKYFAINESLLLLFDEDCYQAQLDNDEDTIDMWYQEHQVAQFDNDTDEYIKVANQSKLFKIEE